MVDMNYFDLGFLYGLLVYVAWTYSSSGFYTCKRIWNRVVKLQGYPMIVCPQIEVF
jgi:hypothetical protein